jgi:hypothetical protein
VNRGWQIFSEGERMNLKSWSIIILMMGFFLVFSPLGAQADPYSRFERHRHYHHPHGKAYGWHGARTYHYDRHRKHFRHSYRFSHHRRPYVQRVYEAPPAVAYVAPITPIMGVQPCPQPQPMYSPSPLPGIHGQITF